MGLDNVTYEAAGVTRAFTCFPTWFSRWMCETVLRGDTYPAIPFVDPVRVVLDVGANCGAATAFFASLYPDAVIHSFEPGAAQLRLLEHNANDFDNVRVHRFGLHDRDERIPLYSGSDDTATASIIQSNSTSSVSEEVLVRSARGWLAEESIDRVDILKLDTEGCEIPILEDLGRAVLDTTKIIYVEYHSEEDRKRLDALLGDSHVLVFGRNHHRTGELTYLARGEFDPDGPEIAAWTAQLFSRELAANLASRPQPAP